MHKNKLIIFTISLSVFVLFIEYGEVRSTTVQIRYIENQYAANFSDDRVLIGASHNVFVGKVIKQSGTKERGIGPETQFQVEIIDNIKGELKDIVTVNQEGGYKEGILYLVGEGDVALPSKQENEQLIQPGSTYLFATRYNEKENWYTLNPYPTASKLLSKEDLNPEQLKSLTLNNPRVNALRSAYAHEILLSADIENKKTLNSYQLLQGETTNGTADLKTSKNDL